MEDHQLREVEEGQRKNLTVGVVIQLIMVGVEDHQLREVEGDQRRSLMEEVVIRLIMVGVEDCCLMGVAVSRLSCLEEVVTR